MAAYERPSFPQKRGVGDGEETRFDAVAEETFDAEEDAFGAEGAEKETFEVKWADEDT